MGLFNGNVREHTFHLLYMTLDERDELKKVNAIREFYNKRTIDDETIVTFLASFGKYGIPSIFLIFTIVYWTTGILKYFWT